MNARKMAAGLLVALAAMTFGAGASHAQFVTVYPTAYVSPAYTGTIQVSNYSGEQLTVLIDGVVMGSAGTGLTNIPNVIAGHKVIQLQNSLGVVRSVGRLFLAAGGIHTWTVAAPQFMVPTVGLYQPIMPVLSLGAVQVDNRTPTPANVFIGGRMYGTVLPSQSMIYYAVPAGTQEVIAYNQLVNGQELSRQTINVTPGVRQYVMIIPQYGSVRVINSRSEPVQITVDNGQHTWIQPGQTFDVPSVAVGNRQLAAVVNGQIVQQTTAGVYAGQVYAWYVRASVGTIRVINRLPEVVEFFVNGVSQGQLPAGGERYFQNVEAGRRSLTARDMRGVQRSAMQLDLTAGETRLWVVQ